MITPSFAQKKVLAMNDVTYYIPEGVDSLVYKYIDILIMCGIAGYIGKSPPDLNYLKRTSKMTKFFPQVFPIPGDLSGTTIGPEINQSANIG